MLIKVALLNKAFPTNWAFKWFLPSVDLLMSVKIWTVTESSPADRTFVRLLSCVDSLMTVKYWTGLEGFATSSTFIWLLPGVGPLVNDELGARKKEFPTDQALMCFSSCMTVLNHCGAPIQISAISSGGILLLTSVISCLDCGYNDSFVVSHIRDRCISFTSCQGAILIFQPFLICWRLFLHTTVRNNLFCFPEGHLTEPYFCGMFSHTCLVYSYPVLTCWRN